LNTLPLSSLGNKANLAQALLEARSIPEALYQGSRLSRGGVPDAISEIEIQRITCQSSKSVRKHRSKVISITLAHDPHMKLFFTGKCFVQTSLDQIDKESVR
jgi:hypothetical protein